MYKVGIFIYPGVELLDVTGPFEVFSAANLCTEEFFFEVFTFSLNGERINTMNQFPLHAQYPDDTMPLPEILIIPGGGGALDISKNEKTLQKISSWMEQADYTLSICSAARIMGAMNLLDDRDFCTHPSIYDEMKKNFPSARVQKGERYIKTRDQLFTSRGVTAGMDLSLHMVNLLAGELLAVETVNYLDYPIKL